MKTIIQILLKLIILVCVVGGIALIVKNKDVSHFAPVQEAENINPKALLLKNYLLKFSKPERIEISNLTKKYEADVNEIKNMKAELDPNSKFYITIQFFTDETDEKAPLVAQIRFLDAKSNNIVKEESINLE